MDIMFTNSRCERILITYKNENLFLDRYYDTSFRGKRFNVFDQFDNFMYLKKICYLI